MFHRKRVPQMGYGQNLDSLSRRVELQLQSNTFRQNASRFDRRPLIRIADSLGGPTMKLLHWSRLVDLGRIPRSDESETVDALSGIDTFRAPTVEIILISHRWLRPSRDHRKAHPDSKDDTKAAAINEFSKWRRQWVLTRHGFLPEIYYWIDFSCIDQSDTAAAVPLLPLWVACCERFLRIETCDYDERAWCRLELLLSYVYSFADHYLSITPDFQSRWPSAGTETQLLIQDPTAAFTTNPEDAALIAPLSVIATHTKPANNSRRDVQFGRTAAKCFRL